MHVMSIDVDGAKAGIEFTHNEVRILSNALNEILNGMDRAEFSTRMGAQPSEAGALLLELRDVLRRFPLPDW